MKIMYRIENEIGETVGSIELEKKQVQIISDMLRIYCKYSLVPFK